jgi:hypothetical protein
MSLLLSGVMALVYTCACCQNQNQQQQGDQHHQHQKYQFMTMMMNNNSSSHMSSSSAGAGADADDVDPSSTTTTASSSTSSSRTTTRRSLLLGDDETEQSLIDDIALKLRPVALQFEDEPVPKVIKDVFGRVTNTSETETQLALKPQQFLHLHHMKVRLKKMSVGSLLLFEMYVVTVVLRYD